MRASDAYPGSVTEPRGAVAGDAPATDVEPGAPGTPSRPGEDAARPQGRLDASAHAHLLEEPLPPDAATETAIIYNVTLSSPRTAEPAEAVGDEPDEPAEAVEDVEDVEPAEDPPGPSAEDATRSGPLAPVSASHHLPATQVHDRPATGSADDGAPGPGRSSDEDSRSAPAGDPFDRTFTEAVRPAERRPTVAPTRTQQHRSEVPMARRVGAAAAVGLVVALSGLSGYLWISATEWRDQAGWYQRSAGDLGDDLAAARRDLAGSQAELEAVRAQLATAHERIVELADEKNQALDDWEMTQQVVDYQQRISNAAGNVARALGQCVQGQQELIGYLEQHVTPGPSTPPYDPALLTEFETEVERLCQDAVEANIGLQQELAR